MQSWCSVTIGITCTATPWAIPLFNIGQRSICHGVVRDVELIVNYRKPLILTQQNDWLKNLWEKRGKIRDFFEFKRISVSYLNQQFPNLMNINITCTLVEVQILSSYSWRCKLVVWDVTQESKLLTTSPCKWTSNDNLRNTGLFHDKLLLASAWIPPAMENSPPHKAAHSIFSKFSLVFLGLLYFQSLSSEATQSKSNTSPIMIAHYIFNIAFGSPSGTLCSFRLNTTSYFNSFKTSMIFRHITHLYICSVCLKMQYQSWKTFQFILTIVKCNEGQYLP